MNGKIGYPLSGGGGGGVTTLPVNPFDGSAIGNVIGVLYSTAALRKQALSISIKVSSLSLIHSTSSTEHHRFNNDAQ